MTDWQLRKVNDNTVDDSLQSLELTDTFNRFARIAEVELDDPDSVKVDNYPRGTLVELEVAVEGFFGFTRRFAGFVADYAQDRNSTSLTILSHDFWIRKRTVNRSFSQTRLDSILQTLIEDLTPLTYDPNLVNLNANPEITREWRGEQLETVLEELGQISGGNEDYGATNDLEFFFRIREFEQAPRDFATGEYTDIQWSQDGKRNVNRAIVEYGEGDSSGVQIREDAQDQLDLQDKTAADDPVVIETRKAYPEITDPDAAADKAKQLLKSKGTIRSGTVKTWEAFAVEPGMVTNVVDPETDTDGEFIVAEITYRWPGESPETEVTIADRSVATSEELINLSDDITRVDLRDTDATAAKEQTIPANVAAAIEPLVTLDGTTATDVRLTNTGRNLIRDGWAGEGTLDISEIAVGDDGTGLSRTNESLGNETNRVSATESLINTTSARYDATIGTSATREVGVFDSAGNLIVRAVYDSGGSEVMAQLTVGDSLENELGVLTDTAQEAIRDIIAGNNPVLPEQYAFGGSDTDPTEADTSLGNQLAVQNLDEILIQSASTQSEWESLVPDFADDVPIQVSGGTVESLRIGHTRDDSDTEGRTLTNNVTGDEYNSGTATEFISDGGFIEIDVSFNHRIPSDSVGITVRDETNSSTDVDYLWDNSVIDTNQASGLSLGWHRVSNGFYQGGGFGYDAVVGADIQPGTTYTFRVEIQQVPTSGEYIIDALCVFDERYESNLDFPNPGTSNNGGILDGPQEYPLDNEFSLVEAPTRRNVTTADFTLSANDVSNNFFVELTNDGGVTFETVNNSQTGSVTFDTADTGVEADINLSRYASNTGSIPATGDSGQTISSWELSANPDAITPSGIGISESRAVFPSGGPLDGQTLREAGLLGPGNELLTRSIFAPVEVTSDMTVISSELTRFTQDG